MNLVLGATLKVRCTKILEKGIVVELPDKSTEFIHISNISKKFVKCIEEFVSVGNTYEVRCIEGRARPIELQIVENDTTSSSETETSKNLQKHTTVTATLKASQPERYVPKVQQKMSLDEMILRSQATLVDKYSKRDRDGRRKNKRRYGR